MDNFVPYIIGDVHLGRKFSNGVPLHRRGDREMMVKEDFNEKIANCDSNIFVQTGDLFDAFAVEEAVVLETARVVRFHARLNPRITYVFYRGNHDASKDVNKASSFDVFSELLLGLDNVHVLKEPKIISASTPHLDIKTRFFGFIPWSPFKSAAELADELVGVVNPEWIAQGGTAPLRLDAVFGHWDVESYGSSAHDFNMVPTAVLSKITGTIYTGHVHRPTQFERDGVTVNVVGSMQPYAHGEDAEGQFYVTRGFEEYEKISADETERAKLVNVNIRVLVKEGQVPDPVDCLSFITKKTVEKLEEDEAPDLDIKIEDFDMDRLFQESLFSREVGTGVMQKILEKWQELKNGDS